MNASDCIDSCECLVKLPPFSKAPFPADGDCGNIFEQGCIEVSILQSQELDSDTSKHQRLIQHLTRMINNRLETSVSSSKLRTQFS